jgi:hypothetical protein
MWTQEMIPLPVMAGNAHHFASRVNNSLCGTPGP